MRLGISVLAAMVCGGSAMMKIEAAPLIEIAANPAVCKAFIGFGAEWDPPGYVTQGVTDADFQTVAERVRWMRLPVARIMMQTKWCFFDGSRYDWDTPEMRALYRQLDVCEKLGTTVFLSDWGAEKAWTTAPGIQGVDDPQYAEVIGTYLDYLLREKGYTCIRYFIMTNEPNWEVGDFDKWKRGLRNVAGVLKKRGLDKRLTLAGSDTSQDGTNESWHRLAVDQLHDVLGVYYIHRYAQRDRVKRGGLEDYWRAHWQYAKAHDPHGAAKPCIVGEAGMNDDAQHPAGSGHIDEYGYGVFMADYAVQAARAGSAAVSAWMLDDNSHPGFFWGLWTNKAKGMKLRPWFFPWSLLARYIPGGATIYAPDQPEGIRLLAAEAGGEWTVCVVNRRAEAATVTLRIPGDGAVEFRKYVYAEGEIKTDQKGFPVATDKMAADGQGKLAVDVAGEAVVVLTSMAF